MYCIKCDKHISNCTCGDIEERLKKVVTMGNFAYRACKICGRHYDFCKCENPEWGTITNHEIKAGSNE